MIAPIIAFWLCRNRQKNIDHVDGDSGAPAIPP
jgi:hypothetical protein